jgi:imidazolonepropionase
MKSILIRGARQLLTLRGSSDPRRGAGLRDLGVIQDGAVLIEGGVIREVGPGRRIENLAAARGAHEINACGRVVMPGFVDSHTYVVSGNPRTADYEMHVSGATPGQILESGGGHAAVYNAMQRTSGKTLRNQAARTLERCVRHGTTTLESKSGYGITQAAELKILRVQKMLRKQPISMVSTFMARFVPGKNGMTPSGYIDWLCGSMLPLVRKRGLAEFADIFCEEGVFTADESRRYLSTAQRLGLGLKMHTGQFVNGGGIATAIELGATSVEHAIYINDQEARLLAPSSTIVTLLPGPVFYLGAQRYAPARMLIDRGAAVALASDHNPETSPSHNMQMMLSLACREMSMTPAEAISAATINGAHALRRADRIGSLEPGKAADLIVVGVPDYREIPYHFGDNLVETTMKRGNVIYRAAEVQWPLN